MDCFWEPYSTAPTPSPPYQARLEGIDHPALQIINLLWCYWLERSNTELRTNIFAVFRRCWSSGSASPCYADIYWCQFFWTYSHQRSLDRFGKIKLWDQGIAAVCWGSWTSSGIWEFPCQNRDHQTRRLWRHIMVPGWTFLGTKPERSEVSWGVWT